MSDTKQGGQSAVPKKRTGKRKKSNAPIIAAIICFIAAAVAVVIFALPKSQNGNNSDDSDTSGRIVEPADTENDDDIQNRQPETENDRQESPQPDDSVDSTDAEEPDENTQDQSASAESLDETQVQPEEYILPDSDSRYYSYDELSGLTQQQLLLARNEIYARHGWIFEDEQLKEYFTSCSWYNGTVSSENFDLSVLNEYESANKDLIVKYETDVGYR
jgi:hypothetical protein